jgi:hypothetical protein
MKKYALFVRTGKNPLPRLCEFTVIHDSILAYHMISETIDLWIRKSQLARIIDQNDCITTDDCELFTERG